MFKVPCYVLILSQLWCQETRCGACKNSLWCRTCRIPATARFSGSAPCWQSSCPCPTWTEHWQADLSLWKNQAFLCWRGKRHHMPSAKGHSTEEYAEEDADVISPNNWTLLHTFSKMCWSATGAHSATDWSIYTALLNFNCNVISLIEHQNNTHVSWRFTEC